jgi:hypothetical protein
MAYDKKIWEDRTVERPLTYILQSNGDGTTTLIPSEGSIIATGTPLTAANLNHMEEGITEAHADIYTANNNIASNLTKINGLRTDVDTINTYPKIVLPDGTVPRFEDNDFNNFNKTGFYTVNRMQNSPPQVDSMNPEKWFYLQVIAHEANDYIVQIAYDFVNGIYTRRRYYKNGVYVWSEWISPNTEGKQFAFLTHAGLSLAPATWTRIRYHNLLENHGGMYVPNDDVFDIKVSGFYHVMFRGRMNHSAGSKFEVQFWQIGGAGTKKIVLDGYGMNSGWNYYYGQEVMWLNKGERWEYVTRLQDASYTRTLYPKVMLEKI